MKPGQRPVTERLDDLLRQASCMDYTSDINMLEALLVLIAATRDLAYELEAATRPVVRGIPEDIVGYRAATSDGPDVAVQRYG